MIDFPWAQNYALGADRQPSKAAVSPHCIHPGAYRGQFAQIQNQNALLCFVQLYIFDLLILHPIYMHRVLTGCDFFDLIFFDWNWDHQLHLRGSSQAGGHTRLLSTCCSAVIIIPTIAYSVYFKIIQELKEKVRWLHLVQMLGFLTFLVECVSWKMKY